MRELSQLGERNFSIETVVREVKAAETTELGDSVRKFSGEVVVGEIKVSKIRPGSEIESVRREMVVVKTQVTELPEQN